MLIVRRLGFAALLLCLLHAGSAYAVTWPDKDFVALPCRPTVACTADIVPPGMFEIEMGYQLRKTQLDTGHSLPFVLKFSMFQWLQLQIGGGGLSFRGDDIHFEDLYAGFKFRLIEQTDVLPSFGFSAMLGSPVRAESEDYQRNWNGLFAAYVTKEKGIVHGDFNFGFNLLQMQAEPKVQLWGALAVSVALPHQFAIMGELWGMNDALPVATRDAGFLFALAWAPAPWLVFDIGGDLGLIQEVRQFSGFAGLTIIPLSFYNRKKGG